MNVILRAMNLLRVNGSLKKKYERMATNAGAVYNNAVATGIVE